MHVKSGGEIATNQGFFKKRAAFVVLRRRFCVAVFLFSAAFLFPFDFPEKSTAKSNAEKIKIDFSFAGYGAGENAPDVPAILSVRPTGGDDTALLQAALDKLSQLPTDDADAAGFRGALLLAPGKFTINGQLKINASGVVLRGSGGGADKSKSTRIVAAGTSRRALIQIGNEDAPQTRAKIAVTDEVVTAGSRQFTIENAGGFKIGDRVAITRPSTKEWIAAIGMNKAEGAFADQRIHWLAGSRDLIWDRKITAIDAAKKQITIDAPITFALEKRYGGATIARVERNAPAHKIGLENLILESEYDRSNLKDEEHSWIGAQIENAEDVWIKNVTARHFAGSMIRVGQRARRVTIEDCRSEQPVSEIGGYRRQSFLVEGQQILVKSCFAEAGLNDFAVGLNAAGPNVFLDCAAKNALGASGASESLAAGVLYENVRIEGGGLMLAKDFSRAQGAGWTAANSVVWNSEAAEIRLDAPEGAENFAGRASEPLFETQLKTRIGKLSGVSKKIAPLKKVSEFRLPKSSLKFFGSKHSNVKIRPLEIINGRFTVEKKLVWGGMLNGAWWKGQNSPATAETGGGISITRFAPGRVGVGLTEDLPKLAALMRERKTPFFNGGPGLWYDRRRDDHTVLKRADASVWSPFYEMPWARSGQGEAFDGLSKYDLTRFNPWYFERAREFARLADENGLIYYHNLYNTHNLLETAAHWVDFPFRPGNHINDTGLNEPVWEARNTIHVANQFYDAANPKLRVLHRRFIRHNLDRLGGSPNVVFILAFQFSGPLAFQQFFLDTVAEWEKENRRKVKIAIITSKDITDAILADPVRGKQISVIDTRYWQYRPDGSLWSPKGGQNLAFREIITKDFGRSGDSPPATTPEQAYRQIREYQRRFPDKAIVAWHNGVGQLPALMAGAAQILTRNPNAGQSQGGQSDNTALDDFLREHLSEALVKMSPVDSAAIDSADTWYLADERFETVLLYSLKGAEIKLLPSLAAKKYHGVWFNERTGQAQPLEATSSRSVVKKPTDESWLLLLKAENQS